MFLTVTWPNSQLSSFVYCSFSLINITHCTCSSIDPSVHSSLHPLSTFINIFTSACMSAQFLSPCLHSYMHITKGCACIQKHFPHTRKHKYRNAYTHKHNHTCILSHKSIDTDLPAYVQSHKQLLSYQCLTLSY